VVRFFFSDSTFAPRPEGVLGTIENWQVQRVERWQGLLLSPMMMSAWARAQRLARWS